MRILSNTEMFELDNGVRLCCFYRKGSSVEMQLHIASGSIHEGKFLGCGLSHFLEHMAFQGCAGYPERSIADRVNGFGGDLNAYTGYERTCYRMQLSSNHWLDALDMLHAMVRYPELPAERFIAERDVILRECERGRDDPSRRIFEKFMRTMFLKHPLRYPVIGFKEMISEVTREMAMEYHSLRYTPERCVIVAAGDIDCHDFFAAAEDKFGNWQRGQLDDIVLPEEPLPASGRHAELIYPDPMDRIFCGIRIPGFGSPELPVLELLFSILGTGDGSILNRELILNNPIGNSIHNFCYSFGSNSIAGFSGKADPGKMKCFTSALFRELEKVAEKGISASHVSREKGQQYADHLRELRDLTNVAGEIAGGVLHDNNPAAGDVYLDIMQQCSKEDVMAAAEKYLNADNWVIINQNSGREKKKTRAANDELKLESFQKESGATVVYAPSCQLPLCGFFMALPGGAIFETDGFSGVTKIIADCLTAGCGKYSENLFLRKLDEAGAELDISGGANTLILEFNAPKKKMSSAVSLVAEMLAKPAFPEYAVSREISRRIDFIRENFANPVKTAHLSAMEQLYGKHPYAYSKCGKIEDISALDRVHVADFYRSCCSSGRVVYGFCGDCSCGDIQKWSDIIDDALLHHHGKTLTLPSEPVFPDKRKHVEISLPREQTVVMRVLPGVSCSGDSGILDAFDILHQAENGLASNLFKVVREDNALSYSVGMSYSSGFHPGSINFYAMTAPGAGKKVLSLLDDEILRLGSCGLSEEEFEAARSGVLFDIRRSQDNVEIMLRTAVMDIFYGNPLQRSLSREQLVRELTLVEFNSRIKKYFTGDAGVDVLVMPEEKN